MRIAVYIEGNPEDDLFAVSARKFCKVFLPGVKLERCQNQGNLFQGLQGHVFDLIYLNITGGIRESCRILLKLRRYDSKIPVLLATEHWKYMEQLCDMEPVAIIRKPFEKRVFRLFFADKKAKDIANDSFFEYAFHKKIYRIRMDEILYFESMGRNIVIHMERGQSERFIGQLDEVEKKLYQDGQGFVRSHRSYLIRRKAIRRYAEGGLYLKNDEILPVSRDRRAVFFDTIK